MQFTLEDLKSLFSKKSKSNIFVILAVIGMLLIGFSSIPKSKTETENKKTSISDEEYCSQLEKKVTKLVMAITGDKKCFVAVTIDSGNEYVYANQNKIDTDQTDEKGESGTTTESVKSEEEYIIIEDENGSQRALVITEKKPNVRGVAIVTNGITANSEAIIRESVSAFLGIASRKISITSKYIDY